MADNIHCVGCEGGLTVLSDAEVQQRIASFKGWHYDKAKKRLSKKIEFKGFLKTMSFVNAVAWMANQEMHHPDLEVTFNTCTVHYQTHAVQGVTENDVICVQKVEALLELA